MGTKGLCLGRGQSPFQRALGAKGVAVSGTESANDVETAELLFGLGRAQAATLPREPMHEAVASLNQSLDYYVNVGDVPGALMVADIPCLLHLACCQE